MIARKPALLAWALCAVLAPSPGAAADAPMPAYVFLDVEGAPLPVQDHEGLCELLRTGEPVAEEAIGRGVAGVVKMTLVSDGVRFHAAFRTVDREDRSKGTSPRPRATFRDSNLFELAAYLLDRRLGLHRVPPTVRRTIDGRVGTLQLWLEGTSPEVVLVEQGRLEPPDRGFVLRQKQVMRVFDCLIANVDRNQGNVLVDRGWNLWLIDHTRAFRETATLLDEEQILTCERRLFAALVELDEAQLRDLLHETLESREIAKLELRRKRLVKLISRLVEELGEDAVLFDLEPPGP
jgi:hypothetical protein